MGGPPDGLPATRLKLLVTELRYRERGRRHCRLNQAQNLGL